MPVWARTSGSFDHRTLLQAVRVKSTSTADLCACISASARAVAMQSLGLLQEVFTRGANGALTRPREFEVAFPRQGTTRVL